jgi:hypothetical protein
MKRTLLSLALLLITTLVIGKTRQLNDYKNVGKVQLCINYQDALESSKSLSKSSWDKNNFETVMQDIVISKFNTNERRVKKGERMTFTKEPSKYKLVINIEQIDLNDFECYGTITFIDTEGNTTLVKNEMDIDGNGEKSVSIRFQKVSEDLAKALTENIFGSGGGGISRNKM